MVERGAGKTELKYTIATELSPGSVKFLPEFLKRNYLLKHEKYRDFRNVSITKDKRNSLSYRVLIPKKDQYVDVIVEASVPIR